MHGQNVHGYVAEVVLDVRKGELLADESQHGCPIANVDELKISVLSVALGSCSKILISSYSNFGI